MRNRFRRQRWVITVAASAVAATVAIVLVLALGSRQAHHSARPGSAVGSPVSVPPGQAAQVAAALDRLAQNPASLLADGARSQVGGRVREAVPVGSSVLADQRSWAPDGVGGGTMLVTVRAPGHAAVTYAAVMIREHGEWKVLATFGVGR